jgi:hypothetical protein
MIMKPSEALAAHRAELRRLASHYGLSHPRIFGSVLTGTDDERVRRRSRDPTAAASDHQSPTTPAACRKITTTSRELMNASLI